MEEKELMEKLNDKEDHDECGCSHDHDHHDHDHDHDHHDHDHDHHDREHDECGCGHDHDHHDHGHDHDHHDHDHDHHHHDHDHDHDHHHHDHGHQYDMPGFRVFETHNHEGATICSFEKDIKKKAAEVTGLMENCIKELEKWLDETDATIGHVKGYVREIGKVTTFSTVGCGLNIEQRDSDTVCVGFAGIVFGPSEEELKDKVAEIFTAL